MFGSSHETCPPPLSITSYGKKGLLSRLFVLFGRRSSQDQDNGEFGGGGQLDLSEYSPEEGAYIKDLYRLLESGVTLLNHMVVPS